mgnify:CR=1 FL=1
MDEILIEEKKYVSSKRAAKITGYAKDYIGQLCREGRVPARLVGRSWYVLESAIKDHRFGDVMDAPPTENEKRPTWEAPRYEASKDEFLPSINRLREEDDKEKESEFSQHLQDSWRAWFDRVGDIEPIITPITVPEPEKEVNIPIRTVYKAIYQAPPEELLPRKEPIRQQEERKGKKSIVMPMVQLAGALVAVILATTAVLGSGYFDTYILSNRQVSILAGVVFYNK